MLVAVIFLAFAPLWDGDTCRETTAQKVAGNGKVLVVRDQNWTKESYSVQPGLDPSNTCLPSFTRSSAATSYQTGPSHNVEPQLMVVDAGSRYRESRLEMYGMSQDEQKGSNLLCPMWRALARMLPDRILGLGTTQEEEIATAEKWKSQGQSSRQRKRRQIRERKGRGASISLSAPALYLTTICNTVAYIGSFSFPTYDYTYQRTGECSGCKRIFKPTSQRACGGLEEGLSGSGCNATWCQGGTGEVGFSRQQAVDEGLTCGNVCIRTIQEGIKRSCGGQGYFAEELDGASLRKHQGLGDATRAVQSQSEAAGRSREQSSSGPQSSSVGNPAAQLTDSPGHQARGCSGKCFRGDRGHPGGPRRRTTSQQPANQTCAMHQGGGHRGDHRNHSSGLRQRRTQTSETAEISRSCSATSERCIDVRIGRATTRLRREGHIWPKKVRFYLVEAYGNNNNRAAGEKKKKKKFSTTIDNIQTYRHTVQDEDDYIDTFAAQRKALTWRWEVIHTNYVVALGKTNELRKFVDEFSLVQSGTPSSVSPATTQVHVFSRFSGYADFKASNSQPLGDQLTNTWNLPGYGPRSLLELHFVANPPQFVTRRRGQAYIAEVRGDVDDKQNSDDVLTLTHIKFDRDDQDENVNKFRVLWTPKKMSRARTLMFLRIYDVCNDMAQCRLYCNGIPWRDNDDVTKHFENGDFIYIHIKTDRIQWCDLQRAEQRERDRRILGSTSSSSNSPDTRSRSRSRGDDDETASLTQVWTQPILQQPLQLKLPENPRECLDNLEVETPEVERGHPMMELPLPMVFANEDALNDIITEWRRDEGQQIPLETHGLLHTHLDTRFGSISNWERTTIEREVRRLWSEVNVPTTIHFVPQVGFVDGLVLIVEFIPLTAPLPPDEVPVLRRLFHFQQSEPITRAAYHNNGRTPFQLFAQIPLEECGLVGASRCKARLNGRILLPDERCVFQAGSRFDIWIYQPEEAQGVSLMQRHAHARSRSRDAMEWKEFHTFKQSMDYKLIQVDSNSRLPLHQQIANKWLLEPGNIAVDIHEVRAAPHDLSRTGATTIILQTLVDERRRAVPDDRMVLVDIWLADPRLPTETFRMRRVLWFRNRMHRTDVMNLLCAADFCQQHEVLCHLWQNKRIWVEDDLEQHQIEHGDYVHLFIRGPSGMTIGTLVQVLQMQEAADRHRDMYFPALQWPQQRSSATSSTEGGSVGSRGATTSPTHHQSHVLDRWCTGGSGAEDSPRLPNGPPIVLNLEHGLLQQYAPWQERDLQVHHADPGQITIDFSAASQLLQWLDGIQTLPQWHIPDEVEIHDNAREWLELPWWNLGPAEQFHFYTDGSSHAHTSGSATLLFVQQDSKWYWGGWISKHLPEGTGPHTAELVALLDATMWVNTLMKTQVHIYGLVPEVHYILL